MVDGLIGLGVSAVAAILYWVYRTSGLESFSDKIDQNKELNAAMGTSSEHRTSPVAWLILFVVVLPVSVLLLLWFSGSK